MSKVSILTTDLAWSTPEDRALFSGLSLALGPERAGLVGRNGVGKSTLLRLIAGELSPLSGSVAVGGRVAVLRQRLQVGAEETVAEELFGASEALDLLRRAEAGEASEQDLADADWTLKARLQSALQAVGLAAEPETRLATLSGGQRTRAALAALVFAEPDFLLLDEPTNNLDREGRAAVLSLLGGWRGGALVASHDRELLEGMDAIVELTGLGATRYGGGWAYRAQKSRELAAAEHDLADADRRLTDLARAAQAQAERKAHKDAAGRRAASRADAPKILLGAQKRRAEATSGDQARLVERRRREAKADAVGARSRIEVLTPLTVALPSAGLAAGKEVLRIEQITAGWGNAPVLRNFSLTIAGPERIALVGPNGSGKSTLLALIAGRIAPTSGQARVLTDVALLDQSVDLLDPTGSILDNFRRLNPEAGENACRAALARFVFRADAALQRIDTLSGGQRLRAGLACVLGGERPPPFLLLDEPTNHLDLDSIEAVETGLAAFDGALLVASHDEAFLQAIGVTRRVELGARAAAERAWLGD